MKVLADAGRSADAGRVYAIGRLALFAPSASAVRVDTALDGLAEAVRDGRLKRIAIAHPELAPYGVAAREALRRKGLWEALQGRIVLGENVNQTAQFALAGGVDAAFIPYSIVVAPGLQRQGARGAAARVAARSDRAENGARERRGRHCAATLRIRSGAGGARDSGALRLRDPRKLGRLDAQALALSLRLAVGTAVLLLPLAVALGRVLAWRRFAGKPAVEALFALPLVLPPTVLGYYLLAALPGDVAIGRWYEATLRHDARVHLRRDCSSPR